MGFALAAKGASGWYLAVECCANALRLVLSIVLMRWLGLWGTALAIPMLYLSHTVLLLVVCRRLTGFQWSPSSLKLLGMSVALVLTGFAVQKWIAGISGVALGSILTVSAGMLSLRGVASRLGSEHRIVQMACRIPGGRLACGI